MVNPAQTDTDPWYLTDIGKTLIVALIIIVGYVIILDAVLLAAWYGTSCNEASLKLRETILDLKQNLVADGSPNWQTLENAVENLSCSAVPWSEMASTGFILLGGSVTTIVGYYFGSRGVEVAEERAAGAIADAEQSKIMAEKVANKAELLGERFEQIVSNIVETGAEDEAPISDENVPGIEPPN